MDKDITIEKSYFSDIQKHLVHNDIIAEFYDDLYYDTSDSKFYNKSSSVQNCGRWWDMDFYRFQSVKDITRVNLCRDKFCYNCQSMLAQKRQSKFAPVLDSLRSQYMVCHMIVTVPNCEYDELEPLLDKMYKKFPYLMRYFKGSKKVKGINFQKYGYAGCVRSLEVTYNTSTRDFHPHFHCMILFRKDLDLKGEYVNDYSYDTDKLTGKRVLVYKFSELEILIQKLWFLLMNDVKVTRSSVEQLKQGYDVKIKNSDGYYHECFKYACKGAFDPDKGSFLYDEFVFRVLYYALYSRRIIQGYGLLHNFDDCDAKILENEVTAEYEKIITELKKVEDPVFHYESLDQILELSGCCKYISKNSLKRLIMMRMQEEAKAKCEEE